MRLSLSCYSPRFFLTGGFIFFSVIFLPAQKTFDCMSAKEKKLYTEHIVEGQPDANPVYVRQGYILCYSEKYRIPEWCAYHVTADYLKVPNRERKFRTFRKDPDMVNPVVTDDYTGSGYARGHMAPYFAMGGDRNKNKIYSNAEKDGEDPEDDQTVFEANYMSNIAPQSQEALNGASGPWYKLETAIRKKLVAKYKMELNVFTGSIILDPDDYYIMINKNGETDIAVPDEFYQVIIYRGRDQKYITAAFLFPHKDYQEEMPSDNLLDYLITVDALEQKTGLDFLNKLSKEAQEATESKTNYEFWSKLINH